MLFRSGGAKGANAPPFLQDISQIYYFLPQDVAVVVLRVEKYNTKAEIKPFLLSQNDRCYRSSDAAFDFTCFDIHLTAFFLH